MFLSYINAEEERLPVLDALLSQAADSKIHIVTSVIALAEVVFAAEEQAAQALDDQVVDQIESILNDRSVVTLIEVTPGIARGARVLQRDGKFSGRSIKPMDALHLATASLLGPRLTEIQSYDSDWPRWQEQLGVPIREPWTDSPRLIEF